MIHAARRTRNLAWLPPQRPSSSIRKPSVYPGIDQAKRSETGPVACELPAPADSLWRLIALTVLDGAGLDYSKPVTARRAFVNSLASAFMA